MVDPTDRQHQVEKFLKLFDLEKYRDTKCGILSFGNQRKVVIAMSLIGFPDVVIMDEPLAGIDPMS